MRAIVMVSHVPTHSASLKARRGDRLRVVREDDEWPGWLWCVADSGTAGWTPLPYLHLDGEWAALLRDYDATELSIDRGARLDLHEEVNGWWLATAENGDQGWIPANKLRLEQL